MKYEALVVYCYILALLLPSAVCAQVPEGEWRGYLSHTTCLRTTNQMQVKLSIKKNGAAYSGEIAYYLGFQNLDSPKTSALFRFPINVNHTNGSVNFRYMASEEVNKQLFMIGYYIMGSYDIILHFEAGDLGTALSGLYKGTNGGKGNLMLRKLEPGTFPKNDTNLFAALRKKQQQRKKIQQVTANAPEDYAPQMPAWAGSDSLTQLRKAELKSLDHLLRRKDSVQYRIVLPDSLAYLDIELYDNAEIDGDTISIFSDDILVLHKAGLGIKPLMYRMYKPMQGKSINIRIVAENLGTIPPNTALMQLIQGGAIKRILLRSDDYSNGVIEFKWE